MKIIKAQKRHIPQLIKMWKKFMNFHGHIDPNFFVVPGAEKSYRKHLLKHITRKNMTVLIAVKEKKILGSCMLSLHANPPIFKLKKIGFIEEMFVADEYQRTGVGSALLKVGFTWFKKKGMRRVELTFLPGNKKAVNFWTKKTGFKAFRYSAYKNI
jgi:GNAT superfamily N-acetyltransferase